MLGSRADEVLLTHLALDGVFVVDAVFDSGVVPYPVELTGVAAVEHEEYVGVEEGGPATVGDGVAEEQLVPPLVHRFAGAHRVGRLESRAERHGPPVHRVGEGSPQVVPVAVLVGARGSLLVHVIVEHVQFQILGYGGIRYREDGHVALVVFAQSPYVLLQLQVHPAELFRHGEVPQRAHLTVVFPGMGLRGGAGQQQGCGED